MSHTLQPYPAYKESGVPWLGQVPGHWDIVSGFSSFKENKRKNIGNKIKTVLSLSYGKIVVKPEEKLRGLVPESFETYQIVSRDSIIIRPTDLQNDQVSLRVGYSGHDGIITSAYLCFTAIGKLKPEYAYLLLHTYDLVKVFYGMGSGLRQNLDAKDFKRLPLIAPSLEEQTQIARFLAYQEQCINRYIRNKRRVIALLNEQKQAIIQRAVTRGLDPAAALKPSGVEWLGDIPVGWDIKKIKEVSKVLRGRFSHRPRNDPILYDGEYPFIQTGDIARAKKYISSYKQTLNEKGFAVSKSFPKGTLVMNIAANVGDIAVLDFDACFPDSVVGFFPKNDIDIHYYYYGLSRLKHKFLQDAPVNTQANLNVARIGSTVLAVPPIDEQKKIVAFLDQEFGKIEQAISRLHREIDLIREYRTRLIADVVTGKLDVRGVAVPDSVPDEPLADPLADDADTTEPEEIEEAA